MVDFHTHILPKMDDGSRSTDESVAMLKMICGQGINKVVCTPHFYAEDESPVDFLNRRQASFAALQRKLDVESEVFPQIYLGAEVRYYEGFSHSLSLAGLKIEGTSLLLLEMPFTRWEPRMFKEIQNAQENLECTVVLAHIERYLQFRQESDFWDRLEQTGVLIQSNAEFFLSSILRRHRAFRLYKEGQIHLLGSDCHSIERRPPNLGKAIELIQAKLGLQSLNRMEKLEQQIFCQ